MGTSLTRDITVIIRSSGERTEAVCRKLLAEQAEADCIEMVQEAPFYQALRQTLIRGRAAGRTWTLAVDADLLVRTGALAEMAAFAQLQAPEVLFVSGWCMDKLLCCCRPAGLHLYRTSLIDDKLLKILAGVEASIRPERDLVIAAERVLNRKAVVMPPDPLCLHDHEQYYADVYRKAFVHARKHSDEIDMLIAAWRALGDTDLDFKIALLGARASRSWPEEVRMDVRSLPREVMPLLNMMGTTEKPPLEADALSGREISELIQRLHQEGSIPMMDRHSGYAQGGSVLTRWQEIRRSLGFTRSVQWVIGCRLKKWGLHMMRRAQSAGKNSASVL